VTVTRADGGMASLNSGFAVNRSSTAPQRRP
jgi:hypothetical protein